MSKRLDYWTRMEVITSHRIVELEVKIAKGIGRQLEHFTCKTLASNREWNKLANMNITRLKGNPDASAVKYEDMVRRTFRGNDD